MYKLILSTILTLSISTIMAATDLSTEPFSFEDDGTLKEAVADLPLTNPNIGALKARLSADFQVPSYVSPPASTTTSKVPSLPSQAHTDPNTQILKSVL